MSDTCESCGCPEGVDGHDVLYRRIKELEEKKIGVPRLLEAIASSPGAEERKALVDEIAKLNLQKYEAAAQYLRAEAAKIPLGEGNLQRGFSSTYNALVFCAEALERASAEKRKPVCGCGLFSGEPCKVHGE